MLFKNLRKYILIFFLFVGPLFSQGGIIGFLNDNPFLYNYLIDIANNPQNTFMNFQYEFDNLNPIYGKKYMPIDWREIADRKTDDIFINSWRYRFSLSMNVTATVFSMLNYSFKITGLREDVYIPEIYFGFGNYFYVPMYASLLPNSLRSILDDMSLMVFSGFVGASKSVQQSVKIFGGYRFAYGRLKIYFPKITKDVDNALKILTGGDIDETWMLHDLFFGVTYLIPRSNWETMIVLTFNPEKLFFGSKLEFLYKYVGLGLGYYPSTVALPFRPFVRVQFEF